MLRVHSLQLGDQLHASAVGSLGKMSLSGLAVTAAASAPGSKFPATLVGSRDGGVYAYDVDGGGGVTVGRIDAHDARDGVGALAPPREPARFSPRPPPVEFGSGTSPRPRAAAPGRARRVVNRRAGRARVGRLRVDLGVL